ncbi:MAG: hypothetical protein ABI565_09435 [Vicinamibacteria bacterium]
MKARVGLWIDHSKAVVVALTDHDEEIRFVISKVGRQMRRGGDSPLKGSFEAQQVPASDIQTRALKGHLNLYYDAVIATIRESESILIIGPGEAKGELQARLKKNKVGDRIAAVESADKMTDRQVAARVRKYFGQ